MLNAKKFLNNLFWEWRKESANLTLHKSFIQLEMGFIAFYTPKFVYGIQFFSSFFERMRDWVVIDWENYGENVLEKEKF